MGEVGERLATIRTPPNCSLGCGSASAIIGPDSCRRAGEEVEIRHRCREAEWRDRAPRSSKQPTVPELRSDCADDATVTVVSSRAGGG